MQENKEIEDGEVYQKEKLIESNKIELSNPNSKKSEDKIEKENNKNKKEREREKKRNHSRSREKKNKNHDKDSIKKKSKKQHEKINRDKSSDRSRNERKKKDRKHKEKSRKSRSRSRSHSKKRHHHQKNDKKRERSSDKQRKKKNSSLTKEKTAKDGKESQRKKENIQEEENHEELALNLNDFEEKHDDNQREERRKNWEQLMKQHKGDEFSDHNHKNLEKKEEIINIEEEKLIKIELENQDSPRPKKTSASKADIEKYNYIKMVDTMREQSMIEEDKQEKIIEKQNEIEPKITQSKESKNVFDMFTDSPINNEELFRTSNVIKSDIIEWDDDMHYYKAIIGEILDKKYQVTAKCGKGVFSNVVKALDINTKQEVAIKIIRSDEILMRAGQRESSILQKLNETDKFDKKHIIKYLGSFEYRKHLCLVFEPMDQDLRETLKMFGKKVGLSLEAVRSYAIQIFLALSHLKKNKIIHADIKPDNILCKNNSKTVKLCDFGTAMPVEEMSIIEYLVSRFYRAPEIILGYPYDTGIDMWSAACTIYEIYVGNFLFPGRDNNEMIKLILQTRGKFNNKILKRGEFVYKYFDSNYNFLSTEIDPITKEEYVKVVTVNDKPIRDLTLLLNINESESSADKRNLMHLKDLLEKCLALDPSKRITPEEALKHPFLNPIISDIKLRK